MADPFSIVAGAVGVTDVAVRTSSKLRSLISDFRDAPKLILDLSNEVTEISVVLDRVKESQQAVQSLGDTQHDGVFLTTLNEQLTKARTILTELQSLAATLCAGNSPTERFRWLRKKNHAANLKGKLKIVRERINELLVAHTPSLGSRIKLELHEVRIGMTQSHADAQTAIQTANSNFQATNGELIAIRNAMAQQQTLVNSEIQTVRDAVSVQRAETASHRQQVNDQLSTIHNASHTGSQAFSRIQAEQTRQFNAVQDFQRAMFTELAILAGTSMPTRQAGPTIQPVPPQNNPNSVVFFSFQLPGSRCDDGCRCRCHLPARPDISLRIPPMLQAAAGYLFLGSTGYPSSSARCDVQSCARGRYVRFQASYGFPLWLCLRYMINAFVEASTSGIFTFTLVVRRRMPFNSRNILYEASYGTVETVAHFLRHEKGCVHDVYAFDGRSVLGLALTSSKPGRIEIVRLLLQNGANPDVEDDFGLSFRAWVSQRIVLRTLAPDYIQALEGLLSISCIEALDLSYIHKIVLGILPINLSQALQKPIGHLLNAKSLTGCTPLIYAAWNGNVAAVRALIDAGADVNEVDLRGVNALHYAAISKAEGGPLCVDALLQAGSDYNASTWYGYSPLHTVTENDHVGNGRRLIDAGADIEAKTGTGSTPMTRAVVENAVGMIRCLYDAGASLESTNSDRDTALFVAIESHMKEAAVLLLSLGANAAHVNRKGRTLLHYAAVFLRFETMRTFTEVNVRGQDATARDQDGLTAPQLLEKRQPDAETRTAFAHLVQAWCRPKEADDGASDEEDRFHDAVEFVDGALTS